MDGELESSVVSVVGAERVPSSALGTPMAFAVCLELRLSSLVLSLYCALMDEQQTRGPRRRMEQDDGQGLWDRNYAEV